MDNTDTVYSHTPSPLRCFASLPSPDLDSLDLDMAPMTSPSLLRRSASPLPTFDDLPALLPSTDPAYGAAPLDADTAALLHPLPVNVLLALPADTPASAQVLPPSLFDALPPTELAELLPTGYPPSELTALLAVRRRAAAALADGAPLTPAANSNRQESDYALRKNVPRKAGEPRRRRKHAKEVGREVDALVGIVVGLVPPSSCPTPSTSSCTVSTSSASSSGGLQPKPKQEKKARQPSAANAVLGLAGLPSVHALVARMILHRRERCVRRLGEGRGPVQGRPSPLRLALDAPEPVQSAMEVEFSD